MLALCMLAIVVFPFFFSDHACTEEEATEQLLSQRDFYLLSFISLRSTWSGSLLIHGFLLQKL